MKKILFVGLGLIGGSMAYALEGYPAKRYGITRNPATRAEALRTGAVEAAWPTPEDAPLEEQDLVVLCLPPEACVEFVDRHASRLRPGALLTDVCGVKKPLNDTVSRLPDRQFHYLGGHPMAGLERGGFDNASRDLFKGAHYILTPDERVPEACVREMTRIALHMGCSDVILSDPISHDERIAYTSQLMHVLALALTDQRLLYESYGFEGGSFRGATRVAALDPALWCELFWANRETLAQTTDELIEKLAEYRDLLRGGDREALLARLTDSSERKKRFNALRGLSQSRAPLFL